MRASRRPLRLLLAAGLLAAGATAALTPAAAAPSGAPAVKGSVQQAYKASYYRAATELDAANAPIRDTNPLVLSATNLHHEGAEPTIGVTKEGNAFVVAAALGSSIFASYDKNKTWKEVTPNVAGQVFPPATLDPYLYVGCSLLQWSDDQGKTWSHGNPAACETPVDDHQTIAAGNPPPGLGLPTVGYPNVLYYCVNKVADAQCAHSLDGGQTFSPTGTPAFEGVKTESSDGSGGVGQECGGLHGHIITDPAGRLYLPKGHCGNPWLAVSEDGGLTWRRTQVSRMTSAGIQTSVASDTAGNLYYLWWGGKNFLPYMAVSTDHGKSFGPAVMIAPPGVKAVNFPSIDAGSPGHVAITFPGTTAEDKTPARPWNYYVAVSTDALSALPTFHSATANNPADPIHRGPCNSRCAGMYDFLDVVIAQSGEAWAPEIDTCTSAACIKAPGPKLSSAEASSDDETVVVRQMSGPGMGRR